MLLKLCTVGLKLVDIVSRLAVCSMLTCYVNSYESAIGSSQLMIFGLAESL